MTRFVGPLFIVGLPRSGTKLLRDLLNQHSCIRFPVNETHFIPTWLQEFGNRSSLDDGTKNKLFNSLRRTTFYENMNRRGKYMSRDDFGALCQKGIDIQGVIEQLVRYYCCISEGESEATIWADKTPGYLRHMALLKSAFPAAKFLHIVRDPRDYCASMRSTWGKSIYRAAERWRVEIEAARVAAGRLPGDYMEIRYESLLSNTKEVLQKVCDFLQVDFQDGMLSPGRVTERYGRARNTMGIVSSNQGQYRTVLKANEIRRVEEIVAPMLGNMGYVFTNDISFRPVQPSILRVLRVADALAMFYFYTRDRGLLKGGRYFKLGSRVSSWRV